MFRWSGRASRAATDPLDARLIRQLFPASGPGAIRSANRPADAERLGSAGGAGRNLETALDKPGKRPPAFRESSRTPIRRQSMLAELPDGTAGLRLGRPIPRRTETRDRWPTVQFAMEWALHYMLLFWQLTK